MIKKLTLGDKFRFSRYEMIDYHTETYERLVDQILSTVNRFEKVYGFKPRDLHLSDDLIWLVCRVNNVTYETNGEDQFFLGLRVLLYPSDENEFFLSESCDFFNYNEGSGYEC